MRKIERQFLEELKPQIIKLAKKITEFEHDLNKLKVSYHFINKLIFFYFLSQKELIVVKIGDLKRIELGKQSFRDFFHYLCANFESDHVSTFFHLFYHDFLQSETENGTISARYNINGKEVRISAPTIIAADFFEKKYEGTSESAIKLGGIKELIIQNLNQYEWAFQGEFPRDNGKQNRERYIFPNILGLLYENFGVFLEWRESDEIDLEHFKGYESEILNTRKRLGVFYTPKEITRYLSEQSIDLLIEEKLRKKWGKKGGETFKKISQIEFNWESNALDFPDSDQILIVKDLLSRILPEIKILDNACGTGFFLDSVASNLLRKYLTLYNILKKKTNNEFPLEKGNERKEPESDPQYYFARKITLKNIFGVDLMNGAISITKYKLWLWIIQQIDVTKKEYPISKRLPNLTHNLKCGNTIFGFKDNFVSSSQKILNKKLSKKIKSRVNPPNINMEALIKEAKAFHWGLEFPEIIHSSSPARDGFDLVIGNPPYMGADNMSASFKNWYYKFLKLEFPEVAVKRSKLDLYFFFIGRSMQILRNGGILGYLVPNRIIGNHANRGIRKLIMRHNLHQLVSFSENLNIFEDPNIHFALLILEKGSSDQCNHYGLKFIQKYPEELNSSAIPIDYKISAYFDVFLDRVSKTKIQILHYLSQFDQLGSYLQIHEGVRGKYITKATYRELTDDEKSNYVREVRGKQIQRYYIDDFNGYYLLLPKDRKKVTNKTRQLQPKLIFGELNSQLEATIDSEGYVGVGGVYFICHDELFDIQHETVLLILNSDLFTWLYKIIYGSGAWNKSLKFRSNYLYKMPVSFPPTEGVYADLVDYLLFLHSLEEYRAKYQELIAYIEHEIVQYLIFELYFRERWKSNNQKFIFHNKIRESIKSLENSLEKNQKLEIIQESIEKIENDPEINQLKDFIDQDPWIALIQKESK
ncbi:MAG: Eco57I restriction-modification methylase domain-containing protein [Promethearchaeia archaeon]